MKLTTSTRISLLFSGLTAIILLLVCSFILLGFHRLWVGAEQKSLKKPHIDFFEQRYEELKERPFRPQQNFYLVDKNELSAEYPGMVMDGGMMSYEGRSFMIHPVRGKIVIKEVTQMIEREEDLKRVLLWGLLGSIIVSFFMGQVFVRYALRDLYKLAEKVEQLSIDNLSFNHDMKHLPKNDEIRVVTDSLEKMTQLLKQQVDDIKNFVAGASHELRTPLMILRSSNELAKKTKEFDVVLDKNIATIDVMEKLLSGLLSLTKIDYEFPTKHPMELITIIRNLITQREPLAEKKNITITLSGEKIITKDVVMGSVEMIVGNILDNAIKYTSSGGLVEVTVLEESLVIRDTGIGIDQEHIENIWKPFWQVDSSKSIDEGYGLGLALVKRLVENNGWTISVSSTIGEGTTFTIRYV